MEKVPMTAESFTRLETELRQLKAVDRPEVIREIAAAREHGDLSENAEYHAARDRQSFIEGRIAEIEDKISRADVIDVAKLSGKTEAIAELSLNTRRLNAYEKSGTMIWRNERQVNDTWCSNWW